jgi:hypothetical protein
MEITRYNIAVDVGRSSVKVAHMAGTFQFPFLIATKRAATASSVFGEANKHPLWAVIDGEDRILGNDAVILGESTFEISEGSAFFDASCLTTIFSAAYILYQAGLAQVKEVNLAINLTFDNFFSKDKYSAKLKGDHKVVFRDGTEIVFKVNAVLVMYQGFAGLFDLVADEQGRILPVYLKSEGVVGDIGHQTFDMLHVHSMVVKSGSSRDFGTRKVMAYACGLLRKDHGIMKDVAELEEHVRSGRPFNTPEGATVDPLPVVQAAVAYYASDIDMEFRSFLTKLTPDYLILLGGGALIYGKHFQSIYPKVVIPTEPNLSNVKGMFKLLSRAAK